MSVTLRQRQLSLSAVAAAASASAVAPAVSVGPYTLSRQVFNTGIWAQTDPGGTQSGSASMISNLTSSVATFILARGSFGVAAYTVNDSTTRRNVTFATGYEGTYGGGRSTPIPFPLPAGALPADGTDAHITAISTTGCVFDMWGATRINDNTWTCQNINSINRFTSDTYSPHASTPDGWACRGTSFAVAAGCVWPQEIANGVIDHPVGLILPTAAVKNTYVFPSTDSDGVNTASDTIPEGARIVLGASDAQINALSGYQKIVARCLKDYGGIVLDKTSGTDMSIPCIAPESWTSQGQSDPWAALGITDTYPDLSGVLALLSTARVATWSGETVKGGTSYVSSGCS